MPFPEPSPRLTTGRTGSYKFLVIAATIMSLAGYILLVIFWKGNTNIWESLYIAPGGFGTGLFFAAVFVGLAASVDGSQLATATSVFFLSCNIGAIIGASLASTVLEASLRSQLTKSLQGIPHGGQVCLPTFLVFTSLIKTEIWETDYFHWRRFSNELCPIWITSNP